MVLMKQASCPITTQKKQDSFILSIHCKQCKQGSASIIDPTCQKEILSLLQHHPDTTQLILIHTFVKVYKDISLTYLKELAKFQDEIHIDNHSLKPSVLPHDTNKNKTIKKKTPSIQPCIFSQFQQIRKDPSLLAESTVKQIRLKTPRLHLLSETLNASELHHDFIRPYVRPGFIDSFIQLQPPPNAIFETTYIIESGHQKHATVTIYSLCDSPEKLYFLLPYEYQLSKQDIFLLENVRTQLMHHQPLTASFIESQNTRAYFKRFAKQTIIEIIKKTNPDQKIHTEHVSMLADMFAQYTAGLGIIEDVLHDPHIQDVYVNAPVQNNPLHVVVNGEEYTSNVFLSDQDIDALSSRFRTMSGRPFSEATPVLDMDLSSFHTRIAAIGQPLTPKGTAFAFRRHRKKPWTLAHFIANNMLTAEAAALLSFLIDGQASLLIAGSRGAGKTSLLTALLLEIPQRYRILTIEDTSEIPIAHLQQLGYKMQSLLTRSIASSNESTELHPTDALRTALRLGESVLIIGEVRGAEAKVLFEAMRVGAAGNLIMGTIHGSTPIDVFERIVYDIGVPPTSFKAVDAVVVASPIRKQGGVGRIRRITDISEVVKQAWKKDITGEDVFQPLLRYDEQNDTLTQLPRIAIGQSTVIQQIAKRWGLTVEQALENIKLRTHIKKEIVNAGTKIDEIFLEAACTRDTQNHLWMLIEQAKTHPPLNYQKIRSDWDRWFLTYKKRRTL